MRRIHILSGLASIAGMAVALILPNMALASPVGLWFTEDKGAKVELSQCGAGGALCSKIVWLREPTDSQGTPLTDARNKNAQLRTRPILGLEILTGLVPAGQNTWSGQVYNPEDGNTYKATLMLVSQNQIKLQGCAMMGLICGEKLWTRAQDEGVPTPIRKPGPSYMPASDMQTAESVPPAAAPDMQTAETPAAPSAAAAPDMQIAETPAMPSPLPGPLESPLPGPMELSETEPMASTDPPSGLDLDPAVGMDVAAVEDVEAPPAPASDFVTEAEVAGPVTTVAALPLPNPPAGLSLGATPETPIEPNVIATLPGMMAVPELMDGAVDPAPVGAIPAPSGEEAVPADPDSAPADQSGQTGFEPEGTSPAEGQAEIVPLPDQKPPKPTARRAVNQPAQQAATAAGPNGRPGWAPTPLPWER